MGEVAEASAKRCMELERAVDEAKARGVEGEAAIKELAAKKQEIAGLRGEMCEWISEMKHLKDMETKAKEQVCPKPWIVNRRPTSRMWKEMLPKP